MRNIIFIGMATLLVFLITACQSKSEKKWAETMKVHDEVMLKMQETGDLEIRMIELISRAGKDSNSILFANIDTFQYAHDILDGVDEEMMDWMAHIKAPQTGDNQDSIIAYLEAEKLAIIKVGEHMDQAIKQTKDIIKSLEK